MAETRLDPSPGNAGDVMDVDGSEPTRVLACFCDVNDGDPGYEQPGAQSSVETLVDKPGFKVGGVPRRAVRGMGRCSREGGSLVV
jgi:hypothetical protein